MVQKAVTYDEHNMVKKAVTYDEHNEYPAKLFDITCVIGSVYAGTDDHPRNLAFRMIAEHDADGHYTFPNENGNTVHVTVETERPQ